MRISRIAPFATATLLIATTATAQEIKPVSVPAPETARVTFYQNGLGVVDERRAAEIGATGPVRLTLTGIAPAAIDGSAVIDTDTLDIRRLVYRLQPLSMNLMLKRAVGGTVQRVRNHPETGATSHESVNLIGLDGGLAMIERDGVIEIVSPGELAYENLRRTCLNAPRSTRRDTRSDQVHATFGFDT